MTGVKGVEEADGFGRHVEVIPMEWEGRPTDFAVHVDGAYRGTCTTLEAAERAAQKEREAPETVEEAALSILRTDDRFDEADYHYVGMEHLGGGVRAAAIQTSPEEGHPYTWVSDAEDIIEHPEGAFYVGIYTGNFEDPENGWLPDLSGICDKDDLVNRVLDGLAEAERLAKGGP